MLQQGFRYAYCYMANQWKSVLNLFPTGTLSVLLQYIYSEYSHGGSNDSQNAACGYNVGLSTCNYGHESWTHCTHQF